MNYKTSWSLLSDRSDKYGSMQPPKKNYYLNKNQCHVTCFHFIPFNMVIHFVHFNKKTLKNLRATSSFSECTWSTLVDCSGGALTPQKCKEYHLHRDSQS